jgi:hypothetical protein
VWTAERTAHRTVTAELAANHTLSNGAASGSGTDPDRVPNEHVDEARSAIYSFYAHDDVDVDFGAFALARDVERRFEEFWQNVDHVRYTGDARDVADAPIEPGTVYEFGVLTLGGLLRLVDEDGNAVYIDGADERLGADNWAVVADE